MDHHPTLCAVLGQFRTELRILAVIAVTLFPVGVVHAQPCLEGLDVALGAADVALGGKARVGTAVEHFALQLGARRQAE